MGTISQKIEYLNETKQRQKTLINALGGNITNDTPFREYEQELVGVLPKVTGEGTNISLSPTIEYDLEVGSLKGDTTQNTLTGKNLLPFTNTSTSGTSNGINWSLQNDGGIKINGTSTAQVVIQYTKSTDFSLSADTYVLSTSNFTANMLFQIWHSTATLLLNVGQNTRTLTVSSDTTYSNFRSQIVIPQGETVNATVYIQFEKGSSATSYEPYCGGIPSPNPNYPQDIQVVTGTQEVLITGSNLIGLTTQQCPVVLKAGDKIVVKNETSGTKNLDLFTNLGDSTRNDFWSVQSGGTRVVTVAYDTGAIAWHSDITEGYAWVNKGDSALPYEVYQGSQTYTLHLGDEELTKIGSYQDKIYYDNGKWYKYGAIGKLTGTELITLGTFQNSTSYSDTTYLCCYNNAMRSTDYANTILYCNYFQGTYHYTNQKVANNMRMSSSSLGICVLKSDFATASDLNNWWTTNGSNILIYAVLLTGTSTEITNETLLSDLEYIRTHAMSYSGTTNISSSGDLSIVISASALKQLS